MFTPIYLLPQYNAEDSSKYRRRWDNESGDKVSERILSLIREGAGEDFLQPDFEQGQLGFLEDMWDLKGLRIACENITFPKKDSFEAIDFSYAEFSNSTFRNAYFQCYFVFADLYNCEFIDCVFQMNSFFASKLENVRFVRCDFIGHDRFTNCALSQVEFQRCFFPSSIFTDCRFDEEVKICQLEDKPLGKIGGSSNLKKESLADIYKDIKEAYASGGAVTKSREYFFKQRQAVTRHNSKRLHDKISGYFIEFITGYGLRPFRVLYTMFLVFVFSLLLFCLKLPLADSLLLTSGALFTFGANVNQLEALFLPFKLLYVFTAFSGISLVALFVTVLANVWLREK